jgi:predicted membrane protein
MKKTTVILWGAVLIIIGALFAMNALGVGVDLFFEGWWTLFIIVPCTIGLFTEKEKLGNAIGVSIGVLLLLAVRDVITFDLFWDLLLPVILILVGCKLIIGAVFRKKSDDVYKKQKENGAPMKNCTAVFGGSGVKFAGERFEGAELNAIFGGVDCDLRGAEITEDCVINASAIFGGVDIFVPEHVNVKIESFSIFGGASDERKRKYDAEKITVYIRATALFGGVDVK